jgi:hypothetical protein
MTRKIGDEKWTQSHLQTTTNLGYIQGDQMSFFLIAQNVTKPIFRQN